MKKSAYFRFFAFSGLAILLAALTGCGGGGGSAPPPPSPPPPVSIATSSLPDAVRGQAYSHTLQASGGTPPYTWSLSSAPDSLPSGLTISNSGTISGTPSQFGNFNFTVGVGDSRSRTATRALSLLIFGELSVSNTFLSDGNVGIPYSTTLHRRGGSNSSVTWSVVSGTLPDGLNLDQTSGGISGTPTTEGPFSFTIQVDDPGPPAQTATQPLSIVVTNNVVILTTSLTTTLVDRPFSETLQVAGGTPPYTWSIPPGSLPNGVSLNPSTGEISGAPTESGFNNFLVQATDSSATPKTGQRSVTWDIRPLVQILTTTVDDCILSSGSFQTGYGDVILLAGGILPRTWRIVAGSLPADLSLSDPSTTSTLAVSGTCTELGAFNFTLEVADSSSPPSIDTQDMSIRVNPRLVQSITSFPEGIEGQLYQLTLTATGGVLPHVWNIAKLPKGLTLDPSTGQIDGTPIEGFDEFVNFEVLDSSNPPQRDGATLKLTIVGLLDILTTRLPSLREGASFHTTLDFKGGTPPFTWSIPSGALPPELTLNSSTPEISGTPTATGTHTFTLRVTDSGVMFPQSNEQQLSIAVVSSPGRNDSIATATPLSNGTFLTSISPYANPTDTINPDTDYYEITANAGAIVGVEIFAERLAPASHLDSVLEIVDASGNRFTTCRDPGDDGIPAPVVPDNTPLDFDDPCINDDIRSSLTLDSRLEFEVPGAAGTTATFYVHVLDFRGDARPGFDYEINVSGAN